MKSRIKTTYIDYVFVGGTGRSGTTIIADLLNNHPDIRSSLPIELKFTTNSGGVLDLTFGSQFAPVKESASIPFYSLRTRRERKLREKERDCQNLKAFEAKINSTWWDIDAPPPHGRGLVSGISHEVFSHAFNEFKTSFIRNRVKATRRFLDALIHNQSNNFGEKLWVETTPMNIPNAHRLIQLYPTALFINMVRDPRDTIASLLTKDWGPTTPLEGIEWFEKRIRSGHLSLSKVPKDQQLTISIEELVAQNTAATYHSLLSFLRIEDSNQMADFLREQMKPSAARIGRWRDEITDSEFVPAYEAMIKRLRDDNVAFYSSSN